MVGVSGDLCPQCRLEMCIPDIGLKRFSFLRLLPPFMLGQTFQRENYFSNRKRLIDTCGKYEVLITRHI